MKPITIQEYVKGFTQTPQSTTPVKFINGNHTPLEPARNYLEEKIGVKLPGDKADIVENEYINNPQKATSVLRSCSTNPKILQKAQHAIEIHETISGERTYLRSQPMESSRPSSIRPTKHWLPKKW
jgi:hypothetical protein